MLTRWSACWSKPAKPSKSSARVALAKSKTGFRKTGFAGSACFQAIGMAEIMTLCRPMARRRQRNSVGPSQKAANHPQKRGFTGTIGTGNMQHTPPPTSVKSRSQKPPASPARTPDFQPAKTPHPATRPRREIRHKHRKNILSSPFHFPPENIIVAPHNGFLTC